MHVFRITVWFLYSWKTRSFSGHLHVKKKTKNPTKNRMNKRVYRTDRAEKICFVSLDLISVVVSCWITN